MLSYVIPVEEPTTRNHLNLNLRNGNGGNGAITNNNDNAFDREADDEMLIDENTKLLSENLSSLPPTPPHSNGGIGVKTQNMIVNEKVHNNKIININKANGDTVKENGHLKNNESGEDQPTQLLNSKIKTTKTGQLKR